MIGARLKEERERLGYTQDAFAEIVGAKRRALIEWEKGNTSPTLASLEVWAGIGVDAAFVMTGVRMQENQPLFTWADVENAGHGMLSDANKIQAVNIDSRQTYEFLLSLLMRNLSKVTGVKAPEQSTPERKFKAD